MIHNRIYNLLYKNYIIDFKNNNQLYQIITSYTKLVIIIITNYNLVIYLFINYDYLNNQTIRKKK